MIQKKKTGDTPIDKTYRYLYQVKSIDAMINEKQLQIDNLRSIASSTALHTDSERVQSSGSKDKLGDCCAKIADLCAEINQDIDAFVDTKADVMHTIDLLEDLEERRVLYCRYFGGNWNNASAAGGFQLAVSNAFSLSAANVACRLMYLHKEAA